MGATKACRGGGRHDSKSAPSKPYWSFDDWVLYGWGGPVVEIAIVLAAFFVAVPVAMLVIKASLKMCSILGIMIDVD